MATPAKVLAVASAGGHWTQMMRLRPAFHDCEVVFVSTLDFSAFNTHDKFYLVPDANRLEKVAVLKLFLSLLRIVATERPSIVVSTGAAPGLIALFLGRFFGARTVWIDSLANVDKLSLSGRMAERIADLWLTQWSHLSHPDGPKHLGAVL